MSLGGGYSSKEQSGTSDVTGTQSGSAITGKTEAPGTTGLTKTFADYLMKLFHNPSATTAPAQNNARNQVNEDYAGADDAIRKKFLSTGGGSSGKYGTATVKTDLARRGDLAKVDNSFGETNATLPLTAASLATSLLGTTQGVTQTGQGSTSQVGKTTGESSGWGINGSAGWSPSTGLR